MRRPRPACRWGSTSTSRSAASAASSATSASTPTRTPARCRTTSTCWRASWSSTAAAGLAGRPHRIRLLRRRHAVVPLDQAARGPGERLMASTPWDRARGSDLRVRAGHADRGEARGIRRLGVTRLSLGIENFDDEILELNGRAHRSPEIRRAYDFARSLGFPQINIDLIAGMVGETDENWRACVEQTVELGRTASPSTRWSCRSTPRSAATR